MFSVEALLRVAHLVYTFTSQASGSRERESDVTKAKRFPPVTVTVMRNFVANVTRSHFSCRWSRGVARIFYLWEKKRAATSRSRACLYDIHSLTTRGREGKLEHSRAADWSAKSTSLPRQARETAHSANLYSSWCCALLKARVRVQCINCNFCRCVMCISMHLTMASSGAKVSCMQATAKSRTKTRIDRTLLHLSVRVCDLIVARCSFNLQIYQPTQFYMLVQI